MQKALLLVCALIGVTVDVGFACLRFEVSL